MRNHLFSTEKIKYILGEKPSVDCILCAITENNPDIKSLELFRYKNIAVSLNLYPYNTGHLLVYPIRHLETPSELNDDEALSIHTVTKISLKILSEEFKPDGYNLGYNIGYPAGGSIRHLHQHIVPRYNSEIGFIDVLSGERIIVTDPVEVMQKLKKRYNELII